MPTDYNQGGTMYAQSLITGINNSQAIVFTADGKMKFVASPFGATPVESIVVNSDGTVTIASSTETFPNGTAAAPSIAFTPTTTDGFYRSATGHVDITTGGTARADWSSAGLVLQSTGLYEWSSTTDPTATADTFIHRHAAAAVSLGAFAAASPVAQTLCVQNVATGTADTAGADFSIAGSQGTGTGAGGSILFKLAAAGGAGSTQNALASLASLTSTGQLNLLLNTSVIRFGASSDVIVSRNAAAKLQLGAADAASPVAQTLTVQSVVAGTADTAGTALTIAGSKGTGTGVGGTIVAQVAYPSTTGSTQNSLVSVLTVGATNNQSSGANTANQLVLIAPTVNQSGTAGYDGLAINVTESATGSGTKNLLDLQVGGTSKFSVSNAGVPNVQTGGSTTISTGVGSVKMSTGNAATNTTWIPISYAGTTVFVPAWATNAP